MTEPSPPPAPWSAADRPVLESVPLDTTTVPQALLDAGGRGHPNLLRWRGQFTAKLVEALLRAYGRPGDVVLDPFAGSGTSLHEAARLGMRSIGSEITPAAYILARIHTLMNVGREERDALLDRLDTGLSRLLASASSDGIDLAHELVDLHRGAQSDQEKVLLAALIVLSDFDADGADVERVRSVWEKLQRYVHSMPEASEPVTALHCDARRLPLEAGTVDLVLTSPPYLNVHNYYQRYRRSVEALGYEALGWAASEIGSNHKHRRNRFRIAVQYCLDMTAALLEMRRVCKPTARMVLVVGVESSVMRTRILNGELVARLAISCVGLDLASRADRRYVNRHGLVVVEDILHLRPGDGTGRSSPRDVAAEALEGAMRRSKLEAIPKIREAVLEIDRIEPSPILDAAVPMEPRPAREPAVRSAPADQDLPEFETNRLQVQSVLDASTTPAERNRLGQFATPMDLALGMTEYAKGLLPPDVPVRFLDPAFGAGAFLSALLRAFPDGRIESATGYEVDPRYAAAARDLWADTKLDLRLEDFTLATPPTAEKQKPNLIICNPPYSRHHVIPDAERERLQGAVERVCGMHLSGLAGLHAYFLGLADAWLAASGIAGWLLPSNLTDVTYGEAVKRYLVERVTLLRVHACEPEAMHFDGVLVASTVVWFRKGEPPDNHRVEFSFGGTPANPVSRRLVPLAVLRGRSRWPSSVRLDGASHDADPTLGDFFQTKRGLATGDNRFFILTADQIDFLQIPMDLFRPILPPPRNLDADEIMADELGNPLLSRRLFLVDCRMPEYEIEAAHPTLWRYLMSGKPTVGERYLCRDRSPWYVMERRPPTPFLCTYMARAGSGHGRPFRFVLNHSKATATNSYIMLYPKPPLERALVADPALARRVWLALRMIGEEDMLSESRVYGGGLHKLEPRELARVPATPVDEVLAHLHLGPAFDEDGSH